MYVFVWFGVNLHCIEYKPHISATPHAEINHIIQSNHSYSFNLVVFSIPPITTTGY